MLPMASAGQGAAGSRDTPALCSTAAEVLWAGRGWIMISAIAVSWGGLPGAVPHPEPLSGGVSAGEGDVSL